MLAYKQFPLIEETNTDGWIYSAITVFIEPGGCDGGDGFAQTLGADLVWDVSKGDLHVNSGPDEERRGIFQVYFLQKVFILQNLIDNFRYVLSAVNHQYKLYKNYLS